MDLNQLFGQLGGIFGGGGTMSMPPALKELQAWITELPKHAVSRWSIIVLSGIRCSCEDRCNRGAVGSCVICQRPVCLSHAFVSGDAYLSCHFCVHQAAVSRGHAGPAHAARPESAPSDEELRKKHLKTMNLKPGEDVKAAFKRAALKYHPDRVPEKRREAATKKFLEIKAAYEWLSTHEGAKAA